MEKTKSLSGEEPFPSYSIEENIVCSLLHGIGTLCAVAGLLLLIFRTRGYLGGHWKDNLNTVSSIIFSVSMIALLLASTLYHGIQGRKAKVVLRDLDHSVIYIFIAGAYTPYCLGALRGGWGWGVFIAEWILALTGLVLYNLNFKALKKKEVIVKLAMGWFILVVSIPLSRVIPLQSFVLLIVGGLVYTLGLFWYRMKHIKMTHAIWHVFVLGGAACHWLSVWYLS